MFRIFICFLKVPVCAFVMVFYKFLHIMRVFIGCASGNNRFFSMWQVAESESSGHVIYIDVRYG